MACLYTHTHTHIYIYIERERDPYTYIHISTIKNKVLYSIKILHSYILRFKVSRPNMNLLIKYAIVNDSFLNINLELTK